MHIRGRDEVSLTEWHLGEKMVYNVEVCDIMKEEMTDEPKELSVYRCSSPTLEVPLPSTIVWQVWIGMLEVGNHDKPVVDEQPWNGIVFEYGR